MPKDQEGNPYHIFDDMLEGVQVIDNQWRYYYVNHASAKQGRSTVKKLTGTTMMENYPGIEKSKLFTSMKQCLEERKPHQMLNEFEFPDKSKGYFELRMQHVPEGVLVLSIEITKQKRLENRLRQFNKLLEDMVNQRTRQLADSLEREKMLNEMKSRFVTTASHEFKTPLAAIEISMHALDKYNVPPKKNERQKFHGYIKSSVNDLNQVLEDYLSLDRIEQGQVYLNGHQQLDVLEFVETQVKRLECTYKPGQQIMHAHTGTSEILMDRHILSSIFTNLLSNAIKYSEKPINLFTMASAGAFCLRVTDKGIGISKADQARLGEKFFRAGNTTDIPGTGLGLTIVNRYVELLNGEISLSSEENVGTTVEIWLPNNRD